MSMKSRDTGLHMHTQTEKITLWDIYAIPFQGGSSEISMQTRKKSISIFVFNYKSNDRVNRKGVLTRLS